MSQSTVLQVQAELDAAIARGADPVTIAMLRRAVDFARRHFSKYDPLTGDWHHRIDAPGDANEDSQ